MVGRAGAGACKVMFWMIRIVFGLTEIRTDLGTSPGFVHLRTADGPFCGHPATRYSDLTTIVPSGSALIPLYEVLTASSVEGLVILGRCLGVVAAHVNHVSAA